MISMSRSCSDTKLYHKGKGKASCLESRLHDNACSTDFTFPLARWVPKQPATIDTTLDLCTRYPLWLGGLRQYGIRSLPDTSTHGQDWESNRRPSNLEFNTLSTASHVLSSISVGTSKLKLVTLGKAQTFGIYNFSRL